MAKKSNKNHYPKLKWVVMLAIAISIPVTVWVFNNAPTETRSRAATVTCTTNGGACYKYSCPSGYFSISGSCGSMTDSACCKQLSAPTGLDSVQWYCKFGNPPVEYDSANFWWNKVPGATSYTLYHRIYSNVYNYTYKSVPVGNETSKLISTIYKNLNGRHIQWYVKAHRDSASSKSVVKTTPTAFLSCQ